MVTNDLDTKDTLPENPEDLINEIMRTMDVNKDNKLSRFEFIEGCQDHPGLVRVIKPLV